MEPRDPAWAEAARAPRTDDARDGVASPTPDEDLPALLGIRLDDADSVVPADRIVATAPREPLDPVAVVALVLVILLLSIPAAVLAAWAMFRARSLGRRGGLARGVLIAAVVEIALGVFLTSIYFALLAPVLTLPTV